jgi:hypothetical protein
MLEELDKEKIWLEDTDFRYNSIPTQSRIVKAIDRRLYARLGIRLGGTKKPKVNRNRKRSDKVRGYTFTDTVK